MEPFGLGADRSWLRNQPEALVHSQAPLARLIARGTPNFSVA